MVHSYIYSNKISHNARWRLLNYTVFTVYFRSDEQSKLQCFYIISFKKKHLCIKFCHIHIAILFCIHTCSLFRRKTIIFYFYATKYKLVLDTPSIHFQCFLVIIVNCLQKEKRKYILSLWMRTSFLFPQIFFFFFFLISPSLSITYPQIWYKRTR